MCPGEPHSRHCQTQLRPNNRLQGMRGRPCFRRTKGLRAGPASLTLVSLGAPCIRARICRRCEDRTALVYSTCLYCKTNLGSNEAIEHFPVGTRLAFDAAKGRLWAVCRRCSRWNLSPLEERWEAIEACKRSFRDTRRRVTTENIGMARLGDGLELIRVGAPLRAEFAAWRYGSQLLRRRRWPAAGSLVSNGISIGLATGWLPVIWPIVLSGAAYDLYRRNRTAARVEDELGTPRYIARKHARALRLLPSEESPSGWIVRVKHWSGTSEISGDEALRLAGTLLPLINSKGAASAQVAEAGGEIERAGGPEAYMVQSAAYLERWREHGTFRAADYRVADAPLRMRLALEMAAHEEVEQQAMQGELRLLERAWREAEEIAAIADRLVLPAAVERWVEKYRTS